MIILECREQHRAAKQLHRRDDDRWIKLSDYDAGTWFKVHEWEPGSLDDIVHLVSVLRREQKHYVVRGRLNSAGARLVSAGRCIRRCHTTNTIPNPPLEDAAQQWLMVDVDNYVVPTGMALGSELLMRHVVRDLLPVEFHDSACVWSLSSSTGLTTSLLKCHLWFWLAKPLTSETLKRTLKQRARIDCGLYSPSQPHYTSDPILTGGEDPLARFRSGVLPGYPDVELVTIPEPEAPRRTSGANAALSRAIPANEVLMPQRLIENALARVPGEERRLWTLLFAAAARAVENGWDIDEYDLERGARLAHPVFDRPGLLREARRAIDQARSRVSPLNALEQHRRKLRWQLSQPLNKE
jgi:hypothetical protein